MTVADKPEIAVGLAALGRPAYINLGREGALPGNRDVASMRAATWEVLDAAYAAGVRWVDVARSYGRSEEFLSGWLAERGHTDLTVSSKWGYAYVGGWRLDAEVHEEKEHSLARFEQQWAESTALLGSRISLYQVHSLTIDSPLFTDGALLDRLAALAATGVRVGFSTSGPAQAETVRRAFELERSGQRVFTAVQSTWNVLEPSVGEVLAEARAEGNLVVLKETLANGRLVAESPEPVAELAAARGVTPDAVALAAALAQPFADAVLAGPASVAQLESNLDAARVPLEDAELARLLALREAPADYWAHRSRLEWN
ncbi:aldo/keto reductase [Amycolatopsis magusensis]|uniref:aldo/keto reductase n=1 Tax=Amycolatopsis magusensis TaxID=882444 RepID=UPI0024A7CCC4|nr:aldo/keto reductase [Amycolatopsis magusensis]MDI5981211.1 aldo/keto reductase [Amycolatopsis magusensis]